MLERLQVDNFQVHIHRVIEFDPHVTTIIAPTDHGKSALIRSLRWLALNDLGRVDITHWEADRVRAVLTLDGGIRVSRFKDQRNNSYAIGDKRYDAVRSDVPEDVAQLLNLGEDNFQHQLDPPFWFTSTAGEVSRELNRIINLSAIDDSLADIGSQVRDAKREVEGTEDRLHEAENLVGSLAWVLEAKGQLDDCHNAQSSAGDLADKTGRLAGTVNRLRNLAKQKYNLVQRAKDGQEWLQAASTAMVAHESAQRLKTLLKASQTACRAKAEAVAKAQKAEAELSRKLAGRCPLCGSKAKFAISHGCKPR